MTRTPRRLPRLLIAAVAAAMPLVVTAQTTNPSATQPTSRPNRQVTGVQRTESGRLTVNYQDAPINVVLNDLSEVAGFIIVRQVPQLEGRITLVSRQPISPDEVVPLLSTALQTTPYAVIHQDRILKVVRADDAKTLNIPVFSGNDPEQIPNTDELRTQVIPLKYSDSTQLKTDLQPLINQNTPFTSNASSNVLIITDTAANVKRIVKVVSSLDTSVADQVDVKVYKLNYADATAAAKLVNDVFGNLEQARTQGSPDTGGGGGGGGGPFGGGFNPFGGGRFGGGGGNRNQGGRRTGRVTASSDTRTNSVVVSGPSDTLKIVSETIKQLDANPAVDQVVYVYRLKNAQALNIEQVMNALFNGTTISNRSTQSNADRLTAARSTGSSSFGSSGTGGGRATGAAGGNTGRVTSGGNINRTNLSAAAQAAANDLAGQVSIIADTDSNSLLLRTSPGNYPRVKQVLEELDRAVPQVLIKVLFAEVTHDMSSDIGAQFSVLNLRDARTSADTSNGINGVGTGTGQSSQGLNGTGLGPNGSTVLGPIGGTGFGIPASGTGLVVQLLEQNFAATIRLLETAGKLDVLSRPYILASDNQLASIVVGQEVPFITDSRITDAGQQINTTEYRDIGILLDVIPHVNPEGVVVLDVAPEISTLTSQTVQISETVSQPIIAKRSAQSRVSVKTGQTIVIGGLMQDNLTEQVDKVPLLGDIPFLGELFKRTRRTKTKTELLIFLTPHIAADPSALDNMAKQETGGTRLLPGVVGPGVYQEHLRGLERGEPPEQKFNTEPMVVPPLQPATRTIDAPGPPIPVPPIEPQDQPMQPEPQQDSRLPGR